MEERDDPTRGAPFLVKTEFASFPRKLQHTPEHTPGNPPTQLLWGAYLRLLRFATPQNKNSKNPILPFKFICSFVHLLIPKPQSSEDLKVHLNPTGFKVARWKGTEAGWSFPHGFSAALRAVRAEANGEALAKGGSLPWKDWIRGKNTFQLPTLFMVILWCPHFKTTTQERIFETHQTAKANIIWNCWIALLNYF